MRVVLIIVLYFTTGVIWSQEMMSDSVYKAEIVVEESKGRLLIQMTSENDSVDGHYSFERSYGGLDYQLLTKREFAEADKMLKREYKFDNKLPDRDAIFRIFRFTKNETIMVLEYTFNSD